MADRASPYPLWRTRQRRVRRPGWWRTRRAGQVAAILVLLSVAALAGWLLRGGRPDPRAALRQAQALLAAGDYSGARARALVATAANPAAAQWILVRSAIELGDGPGADTAVTRALAAGVPAARLHGARAAARLLQGDSDGALAEAALAPPGDTAAIRTRARALAAGGDAGQGITILNDVVARDPADAAAWIDLARIRLSLGDTGGGAAAAQRAAGLPDGGPAAATLEGEVLRSRYGPVAALPWFAAALARDPAYPPALRANAATLGDAGRYRAALAAARRLLAARPGDPQGLYLMAVIAARGGKPDLARGLLRRTGNALDLMPGMLLLGGMLDQAGGHPELAVAKWRQLIEAQPLNIAARRLLAAALLKADDAAGALDAIGPVVRRIDADRYTLDLAARASAATGDAAAAAGYRDRAAAIARAPAAAFAADGTIASLSLDAAASAGDPHAALALIRGLAASGASAAAIQRARALAGAFPGAAPSQLVLGDALALAGRYGEATTAYARAADLSFDEPTLLRLVDALGRTARARDAASVLSLYLVQNPASLTALRLAGHWQVLAGDHRDAIATLERVRRAVGNREAAVLADLALAYAATGQGARAVRYGAAAYRLEPMDGAVVLAYAAAAQAAGNADGARQLRAKAAALARGDGARPLR